MLSLSFENYLIYSLAAIIGVGAIGASIYNPFVGLWLFTFASVFQPGTVIPRAERFFSLRNIGVLVIVAFVIDIVVSKKSDFTKSIQNRMMAAFILLQILSLYKGVGIQASLPAVFDWSKLAIFYLLVINMVNSLKRLKLIIWAYILGSIYPCYYAIHMYHFQPELLHEGRAMAYGWYDGPNAASMLFICAFSLAFKLAQAENNIFIKLSLFTLLPVFLYAISLTGSRGGLLAIGFVVLLVFVTDVRKGSKSALVIVPIVIVGILATPAVMYERAGMIIDTSEDEGSMEMRYGAWRSGLNMVKAHPILGVGSGRFGEFYVHYTAPGDQTELSMDTHSTYVKIMAESGLIALFCYLAIIYLCLKDTFVMEKKYRKDVTSSDFLCVIEGLRISLMGFCFRVIVMSMVYSWPFVLMVASIVAARRMSQTESGIRKVAHEADRSSGAVIDETVAASTGPSLSS